MNPKEIADFLMRKHNTTPSELRRRFDLDSRNARLIYDLIPEAFGPGGRGYSWLVSKIQKVLGRKARTMSVNGRKADKGTVEMDEIAQALVEIAEALTEDKPRTAARGPDKSGRNWKERDDNLGHRWIWDDGETTYWVKEIEGPGVPLYLLMLMTPEIGNKTLKQRPLKKLKDVFTIAAEHYAWLQTQSGMYDYPRMGWKTASQGKAAAARIWSPRTMKDWVKTVRAPVNALGHEWKKVSSALKEAERNLDDRQAIYSALLNARDALNNVADYLRMASGKADGAMQYVDTAEE